MEKPLPSPPAITAVEQLHCFFPFWISWLFTSVRTFTFHSECNLELQFPVLLIHLVLVHSYTPFFAIPPKRKGISPYRYLKHEGWKMFTTNLQKNDSFCLVFAPILVPCAYIQVSFFFVLRCFFFLRFILFLVWGWVFIVTSESFSSCCKQGLLIIVACWPLIAAASLVAERRR